MAQDETFQRQQRWTDYLTKKKRKLSQLNPSQQRAVKEINALKLLSLENSSKSGGAHPPFDLLNYTQNKVARKKGRDTLVPKAHHV